MLRDSINQDQMDILLCYCNANLYMGQVGIMVFAPVKEGQLHFPFSSFAQFSHRNPFVVVEHFPLGRKSDYETLAKIEQSIKNLVIIVSPIHNKGSFPQ